MVCGGISTLRNIELSTNIPPNKLHRVAGRKKRVIGFSLRLSLKDPMIKLSTTRLFIVLIDTS